MRVVKLARYRNRELVEVCRELLRMAEEGEASGLAFVVKVGRDHQAGMTGEYSKHPEEALSAVFRMERHLMQGHPPYEKTR
jgi:hypothetical protein